MPIVVDVNNVLHVTGVLPPELAGPDEAQLAALIANSRFQREPTCLVCDGPSRGRPTGEAGCIVFHYAGSRTSADAVIARIVAACTAPKNLTVVSTDRAVVKNARRRKCPTLSASEFLEILAQDHAASKPQGSRSSVGKSKEWQSRHCTLTPEQVQGWLVYFGLNDPACIESLKQSARSGPAHRRPKDPRTPRRLD